MTYLLRARDERERAASEMREELLRLRGAAATALHDLDRGVDPGPALSRVDEHAALVTHWLGVWKHAGAETPG